jgi:hypothetical protein
MSKNRVNFFVFLVVTFFVALLVVAIRGKPDGVRYARPFEAKMKEVAPLRKKEESKSRQPDSGGFRESDIRKYKGNRYETY